MPGVGFSAGCERIALLLRDTKEEGGERKGLQAYVVYVRKEQRRDAFLLVSALRREGIRCDMNYEGKSVKAQMRAAERTGSAYAAILGPDEVEKGIVKLKNMETGEESEVPPADIPSRVDK
jgi:histidyl-tRNA synthetase